MNRQFLLAVGVCMAVGLQCPSSARLHMLRGGSMEESMEVWEILERPWSFPLVHNYLHIDLVDFPAPSVQ